MKILRFIEGPHVLSVPSIEPARADGRGLDSE